MTCTDCHIHIVAEAADMPMLANRTYTPSPASLATLRDAARLAGVGRFVVVQPSFYGTDNRVTLQALDMLGPDGRGVAVIDPAAIAPNDLADMNRRGIRGLRLNLYSTLAAQDPEALGAEFGALASVAARMGWHVELLANLDVLARNEALLSGSAVPVVIDHYGLYAGHAPTDAAGTTLLSLLRQPHVWMKLSAPYRSESDPLATRPDPGWVAALLGAGKERCVWGSDWPHTPPHELQTGRGVPLPYRSLPYKDVVAGFTAAVGDGPTTDAILAANPARLYGFE